MLSIGLILNFLLPLLLHQAACAPIPTEERCGACQAVADALLKRLSTEKIRKTIDLRHRIDPEGRRTGKVVQYKVSELRALDMLDNLCEDVNKYRRLKRFDEHGKEGWIWVPPDDGKDKKSQPTPTTREAQKAIGIWCYELVDKYEQPLAEFVFKDRDHSTDTLDHICETVLQQCKPKPPEEDGDMEL